MKRNCRVDGLRRGGSQRTPMWSFNFMRFGLVSSRYLKYLYMIHPMEVYVNDEAKLTLHGLQQHYVVIFVKSVQRCMALAQLLVEQNFPAIAIHRAMAQEERLSRYQQFSNFQKR
ncbi:hypothetical protein Avbf_05903 [Armadillidium vulgare]|nr:hypothetical protein Avbf_05903 [Armadillidium vulgare]